MRVLLIDDDEVSREVLAVLLAQEEYEVISAASGDEAVARLREAGCMIDVVLTDQQMPGLSEAALGRALRELCGPGTKLVAMSGSAPAADVEEIYDAFLLKPFAIEQFCRAVGQVSKESMEAADEGGPSPLGEVLDSATFERFAAAMNRTQMEELYGLCLRDAGKQRAAMMAADAEGVRRAAHTMKGSFGMLGARELHEICARIEQSGMMRDASLASMAELDQAMARLRRMLRARGLAVVDDTD